MLSFNGTARPRSAGAIAAAAASIGVEPAALRAVVMVEAAASGFDKLRRPKMLFEPHIFYRRLSGTKRGVAVQAGLAYPKWGTRPYPAESYPRLQAAQAIDEPAALSSASWGLPQIMGGNHVAAGFAAVSALVQAFCVGEDEQIRAMAAFIGSQPHLLAALRAKAWAAFAAGYNGIGYKRNGYDKRLAKAHEEALALPDVAGPSVNPAPLPPIQRPTVLPRPALPRGFWAWLFSHFHLN